MKTFEEHFNLVILEMARPSTSFKDYAMNKAYVESLKKFRELNVFNANTFVIWDFIFRQLPENIKTPEIIQNRKKASGSLQRDFVLNLINNNLNSINFEDLAFRINDTSNISSYINRSDVGSRQQGKRNAINEMES